MPGTAESGIAKSTPFQKAAAQISHKQQDMAAANLRQLSRNWGAQGKQLETENELLLSLPETGQKTQIISDRK
jgi:hypothetical protein